MINDENMRDIKTHSTAFTNSQGDLQQDWIL